MQQETMQQERQLLAEMQAAERASIDELVGRGCIPTPMGCRLLVTTARSDLGVAL